MNNLSTKVRWLVWLGAFAVGLCLVIPLWAQVEKLGRFKNFKFPDYYDPPPSAQSQTNQLKTLVTGTEALPQPNALVFVKEMRMENYATDGQTNLIAQSPECFVDTARREVSSAGKVQARTGNGEFFIEGDGFLCRLTNFSLIISNRVRTVIHQGLIQPAKP